MASLFAFEDFEVLRQSLNAKALRPQVRYLDLPQIRVTEAKNWTRVPR